METNNIVLALRGLHLSGMADALERQFSTHTWGDTAFEDRVANLIETEVSIRNHRRVARILKTAKLRYTAAPEKFDFSPSRHLDKSVISSLLLCQWVQQGQTNLLLVGKTGTGKSWASCAIGVAAARKLLSVGYYRVGMLLEELETARHDGERMKKREALKKLDLLILDDFGLEELSRNAVIDLLNLLDDRVGRKSTIVAAQMPIDSWHDYLGGDATADAIMDRLIHTSRVINFSGKSLRASAKAGGDGVHPSDSSVQLEL